MFLPFFTKGTHYTPNKQLSSRIFCQHASIKNNIGFIAKHYIYKNADKKVVVSHDFFRLIPEWFIF